MFVEVKAGNKRWTINTDHITSFKRLHDGRTRIYLTEMDIQDGCGQNRWLDVEDDYDKLRNRMIYPFPFGEGDL